jgi:hypothetical protein
MNSLTARHPSVKRISLTSGNANPDLLFDLICPYLEWQVGEIDERTNLLLFKPRVQGTSETGRLVILEGIVAKTWLKHRYPLQNGNK